MHSLQTSLSSSRHVSSWGLGIRNDMAIARMGIRVENGSSVSTTARALSLPNLHYQIRENRHQISWKSWFSVHFNPFSVFVVFSCIFWSKNRHFFNISWYWWFVPENFFKKNNNYNIYIYKCVCIYIYIYLGFQWLLRGVFWKRLLTSAPNEYQFDP